MKIITSIVLLVALLSACMKGEKVDLIVHNAKIHTMDLSGTIHEAIAIRDGKIYARGSADDKGQFFMHLKAFEAMLASGNLTCNVKFMIEGEEEVGF